MLLGFAILCVRARVFVCVHVFVCFLSVCGCVCVFFFIFYVQRCVSCTQARSVLLSPQSLEHHLYGFHTSAHTQTHAHAQLQVSTWSRERSKKRAYVCVCVCVCVCGCTSTGVCRLIKFISSGHVAAGNQCCEGKRPRRQSVCVCVCACVCKPVYLCVSLGRRMANISTADDPLLLTHTRSR